ncbi:MAG: N-acetylmuramoyl-L-alanine amidase [Alphaproteobacteria bacterium 64-11]|nr:N-acetylmuramoyl-L-alanine amidase [Alphaproteobacteria bacterium]OJU12431.1 MAG: N-acetylmuramoyl-L-alanine amidase [Alphaproteobacteria bacterium 64-11]
MRRIDRPSPNHDTRADAAIDMLVLHYTGMPTAEAALARLTDPAAKVSAHYTIDDDGTVYAHVPEARRAWHAGAAHWAGASDINARSIGIELVNPGHEFGYRPFPEDQIASLTTLCHSILMRHPIPSWRVVGHSDVAPARKEDPGEFFPWARLAKAGIGLWPTAQDSDLGPEALARYGYDPSAPLEKVILAFQRHFRPRGLTGVWDDECAGLLAGLLARLPQSAERA